MLRRGGRRGMLRRMWCATAAHSQSSWRRARQRGGNSHVLRRSTGTAPIAELSLFIAPFAELLLSLFIAPVAPGLSLFMAPVTPGLSLFMAPVAELSLFRVRIWKTTHPPKSQLEQ